MNIHELHGLLIAKAWLARENAYPWKSGTKVGCAIETQQGIYQGWNIEGLWMTSIHAEVSAISKMPLGEDIIHVAVVAETSFFTPCGACLDWLIQFATNDCDIFIQGKDRKVYEFKLRALCPHYPKQ